jgi:hypothetical protein
MTDRIHLRADDRKTLLRHYWGSPVSAVRLLCHVLLLLDAGHPWALIAAVLFVFGVLRRQRPTAKFDPEFHASLFLPCLFCTFLMGLEDTQPADLALGRQPCQGLSKAQALVFVEPESLGHDRCPEGQDRRSVDGDGFCHDRIAFFPFPRLNRG